MPSTRSDTGETEAETHEDSVRAFLRANGEVASKEELRAGTDVPAWYINQIATTDTFYTSLNHTHEDDQLAQRETDQPKDVTPDDPTEDGYLYRDELVATFLSVAVSQIQSIPSERAAALVLRQFEGDSFDELQPDELRDCLQSMCGELLADHDHAGEFIVIDGTHIAAWANTRDEIENGDVEGASWGKHEGSFYGYKVFLVVDAASELPVAITMETGKRNDTVAFEPLIKEFDERYDTDNLQAALADAGFDSQGNREFCQEQLECPLLTAINPRRSSPLKKIRDDIKQLFKEREDEFDSPYEALEELPQQLLSDYGVEAGSVRASRETAQMPPPERHRSQAARISDRLLIDQGRLPAYSAVSIRKPVISEPSS